jgi:hypothetical protein
MAYSIRRPPENTKEIKQAAKLGKLLTEDFAMDLEGVGFHLVRNLPIIVYHRFEVLSLTAMEEYDKLMLELKGENYGNTVRR